MWSGQTTCGTGYCPKSIGGFMGGIFKAEVRYSDTGEIEFECYMDGISLGDALEGLILLAHKMTEDAAIGDIKSKVNIPSLN